MSDRGRQTSAVYRLLLLCYPAAFRDEFAEEMTLLFGDEYHKARVANGFRGG